MNDNNPPAYTPRENQPSPPPLRGDVLAMWPKYDERGNFIGWMVKVREEDIAGKRRRKSRGRKSRRRKSRKRRRKTKGGRSKRRN